MSETNPYEGKALVMCAQKARCGGLEIIRHGGGPFGLTVEESKSLGDKISVEVVRRNGNGDVVGTPKLYPASIPCSELEEKEINALLGPKAWDSGRKKIIPVVELVEVATSDADPISA